MGKGENNFSVQTRTSRDRTKECIIEDIESTLCNYCNNLCEDGAKCKTLKVVSIIIDNFA